jgi:hypothetical protein
MKFSYRFFSQNYQNQFVEDQGRDVVIIHSLHILRLLTFTPHVSPFILHSCLRLTSN